MRIMVHELKSPVTAAKMMADLLMSYPSKHPKIADIPGRIANRMDDLLQLIRDMLELAKVKSGMPLGDISILDLVSETQDGCKPYLEQAEAKGFQCREIYGGRSCECDIEPAGCMGDFRS
jgi:signal transduction histidine kinase